MPGPMAAGYDFAIFGTTALSALLAGLLAHDHGRQVLRIGDPVSPERLPRSLDLALPLAARPSTWRMVRRAEAETLSVLRTLDAATLAVPTDVRIVADLTSTRAALSHLRHVAAAYRSSIRGDTARGVTRLQGAIGLAGSNVQSVGRDRATLAFDRDGVAGLSVGGEPVSVGHIVLADDAAILDLLPEAQRPAGLQSQAMTATLTAPTRRLPAPVLLYPDRNVALAQRQDLSVLALVGGDAHVESRLAACLPGPFPLRRRSSAHYRSLVVRDGAPLIGRLPPANLSIVAGLGHAAAFFAPSVARWLTGTSDEAEAQWFTAHDASRADRDAVADWASVA